MFSALLLRCSRAIDLAVVALSLGGYIACGGGTNSPPRVAPSIIGQPVSQIATVGDGVSFSVTASGTAPFHYHWMKTGVAIGIDSPSYTISSAQPSDAGSYSVKVTNDLGSATSNEVTLGVVAAPTITSFTAAQSRVPKGTGTTLTAVFSDGTGAIDNGVGAVTSGTPAATPNMDISRTFTLTVTNAAGTTTTAQVRVDPIIVTYGSTNLRISTGLPVSIAPTNYGDTALNWAIAPALPAGLEFNTSTGSITGTPSTVSSPAGYVITAITATGQYTATLTIEVASDVLLDLGHAAGISKLQFVGDRILSQDSRGHWVLWNYTSGAILAKGDSRAELAGSTLAVQVNGGVEIRDAADAHVRSTIVASADWWSLAGDGSYLCAGAQSELSAWTPTGQILFSKPGDYRFAVIFGAPGEVRVAKGPAGADVIETIATATGASSFGPAFSGQFHSWFQDGERFLTNLSTTVWTYSKASIQEGIIALPAINNLTGQGNWIWAVDDSQFLSNPLNIYAVGGGSTPIATYIFSHADVYPSGETIAVVDTKIGTLPSSFSLIDLSGPSPSKIDLTLPISFIDAYASNSASHWVVGTSSGVILDGMSLPAAPRYLGFGDVRGLAGGGDRAAVAIATGNVLHFNATTKALEGSIPFSSSKLTLSDDGAVLVAEGVENTLKAFALPSETLIISWPYPLPASNTYPFDFSVSASGQIIGQVLETYTGTGTNTYTRQVTAISGGPLIWSDAGISQPIRLSPNGTLIAVSASSWGMNIPNPVTNIYRNGVLTAAVPGWAVGWVDDARLLVNLHYVMGAPIQHLYFGGCALYGATGALLSKPPLPEMFGFQTINNDSIYSSDLNSIFSLTTGTALWTSPYLIAYFEGRNEKAGASAGQRVIFKTGACVLSVPY